MTEVMRTGSYALRSCVVDILLNKDKYTTVATKMQACSERARGVRGLVPTGKF